jgi:hypothetical protein
MIFTVNLRRSLPDTSTDEPESDCDCECSFQLSEEVHNVAEPIEHCHLFNCISDDQKFIYSRLNCNLKDIYSVLDKEIEPICIREYCAITPKTIGLSSILNSCLSRRRSGVIR